MSSRYNRIRQDGEIIDLLFARSEQGLDQIQSMYGKLFIQVARNILGNEQDAEECVNDTLVKIWESIPPNRPHSLLAYALRIVRNLSLNRLESMRTQKRGGALTCIPFSELEEHLEGIAVPDESESKEFERIINEFWIHCPKKTLCCLFAVIGIWIRSKRCPK